MKAQEDLDKLVADKVFGMIECDKWEAVSFGSAGGWVLQKCCDHEDGKCYSSYTIDTMHGKIGGVPPFSTNMSWTKKVLDYLEGNAQIIDLDHEGCWQGGVVVANKWLTNDRNEEWVEGTFEEVICELALMVVDPK